MATSDPATALVDGPLDLTMMLAIHSALRRDVAHLALLHAMEDEHARIDPLSAAVDGALADHGDGHHRLGDIVDAFTTELTGHLAHEERDALPLINRVLTRADWRAFEASQRRKTGLRGAAEFLPWLLDGTTAEEAQAVLHRMPPPVRLVYRRLWQPRYTLHDRWEPATR